LCRCTGYRPIIAAAEQLLSADAGAPDKFELNAKDTITKLSAIEDVAEANGFYNPRTIDELCELRARHPDAPILAGGTDLTLEITQRLKCFEKVICIQHLADLAYLTSDEERHYIGPCCTIANLVEGLQHLGGDVVNLLYRFGATQVRNQATVGGSIANASPIGTSR